MIYQHSEWASPDTAVNRSKEVQRLPVTNNEAQ